MTAAETAGRAAESQQLQDRDGRPAIKASERGQGHPGQLLCLGGRPQWLPTKGVLSLP